MQATMRRNVIANILSPHWVTPTGSRFSMTNSNYQMVFQSGHVTDADASAAFHGDPKQRRQLTQFLPMSSRISVRMRKEFEFMDAICEQFNVDFTVGSVPTEENWETYAAHRYPFQITPEARELFYSPLAR
eukprot:3458459-Rhodomonas_salina.1